ncbi:MAG: hypothetical protein IPJ40_06490 [Saprospirales bacterium]|nr:hypothetical protein [Saprospirales bacterium]
MTAAAKPKRTWRINIVFSLFVLFVGYMEGNAQTGWQPSAQDSIPTLQQAFLQPPGALWLPATAPTSLFCLLEWNWEKKTQIPLRIRLGTLDYVDQLEGKGSDLYTRSNKSSTPGVRTN